MKKILLFIALVALIAAIATSCTGFESSDNEGDENGGESGGKLPETGGGSNGNGNPGDFTEDVFVPNGDGIIFSSSVDVTVIKGDGVDYTYVDKITSKIYELTGNFAVSNTDADFVDSKEIVLGDTTRNVSKKAKNAYIAQYNATIEDYKKKGFETRYLCGYVIYSSGDSVAIYWDDEVSKEYALEHFVNKYLQKPTLCLEKGYTEVNYIDKYELMKNSENEKREAEYAKIAAAYGEETADAVRAHLSMFDENFYLWLADLYDPGAYDEYGNPLGGGFYYSNSARDTAGYGIDIESTAQALSFLTSAGLLKSSTYIKKTFPEKMQKEMIAFALSCQSSVDGYFYHPQWGTNVQISRISRDLGNAVWILEMMGTIPYWDTPSNVKGSLGAPSGAAAVSALTEPLANSSVASVSKVLAVAGNSKWTGSQQLSTLSAWESYLTDLTATIRTKSYSIGNTVGSQASQVKARDIIAMENGELKDEDKDGIADGGYVETFERIFNDLQLENGLWEECSVEEGNVYYAAINGLMKISSAYNGYGVKMNYAEEALKAAAFMITYIGESEDGSDWADSKGERPDGSVDVYNPWVCASAILKNITTFSSAEEAEALKERVIKANALEMITVTTKKIAKFKKADGSYGYTWTYSPSSSQGAPASVPGTVEGDINGGCIAFTGTFSNMASVLGFGGLKLFGESDLHAFLDRASSREHIVKAFSASFDGETVGEAATTVTFSGDVGSATIIEDPREGALGNVVLFDTVAGKGCSINLSKIDNNSSKSGICLEWEMAFTDITVGSSTSFQIKLGSSYMFVIGVDKNGKLKISDSSSTNGNVAKTNSSSAVFNAYEWNSFKVEYYVVNASKKTTAAKVYVNGELCFVSDTYISKETEATPSSDYGKVSFYALNATDFTLMFDNIKAYDLVKKYVAETPN